MTLAEPKWNNTTLISDGIVGQINALKNIPGGDILVAGSSELTQTLIDNKLVDEFNLLVYPKVLGKGKRLFKDGEHLKLKLLEDTKFSTGVILTRYAVEK